MVVFLLVLVLGGAAVIWHDLPVWMYAVLIVVTGWRMSVYRHAHGLPPRGEAPPPGSTDQGDERP